MQYVLQKVIPEGLIVTTHQWVPKTKLFSVQVKIN